METTELLALYGQYTAGDTLAIRKMRYARQFNEFLTNKGTVIERAERVPVEEYLCGLNDRYSDKVVVKSARQVIEHLYRMLEREGKCETTGLSRVRIRLAWAGGFTVRFASVLEAESEGKRWLGLYEEWLKKKGDKRSTVERKLSEAEQWLLFLRERGITAGKETERQVEDYFRTVVKERNCGWSALRTVNATLRQFRRLILAAQGEDFREGKEIRLLKRNGHLPVLEERPEKRELTGEEKETLAVCRTYCAARGGVGVWMLRRIEEYFDWCAGEGKDFKTADEAFVESYRNHLVIERGELSRGTINRKLVAVKVLYRVLVLSGLLAENPARTVRCIRQEVRLPRNILTVEDMGRFLGELPVQTPTDLLVRTIAELLYGCSLRISEAWGLKLSDIDLDGGWLTVTEMKNRGKRRRVPLCDRTRYWLKKYLAHGRERLLSAAENEKGTVFPKSAAELNRVVNRFLGRQSERLGMKRLTSHCFRHSAATHLLQAGAGIREVQAFLGHETIRSTQVYTRVMKDDLKRCIAAFHPREKKREGEHEEADG